MSDQLSRLLGTYSNAWIAACLIAIACSLVSVYVVLRRVAFIGIASAQIAAAGVAFALLVDLPPLPAAAAATLLGIALFATGREPVRVSREALVGVAFALASALSVLFVFRSSSELDHIEHVIYGSLLFTSSAQVKVLAIGAAFVLAIHVAFAKEFLMVSFDRDTAQTLGVRTRAIDLLLFATIGAVIALAIGSAGSLLTFCLLVVPALVALLLAERMPAVFVLAIATGVISAAGGVLLAIVFDLPPGPTVVVTAVALLVAAAAASLRRSFGIAVLLVLSCATAVMAWRAHRPLEHAPALEVTGVAKSFHADVELVAHSPSVRRGEKLTIDFATRVRGRLEGAAEGFPELHLLLQLGDEFATARFDDTHRSGRIDLGIQGLTPGLHAVSASVWTGPPLDPTVDTRVLAPDEVSVNELAIEVRP